MDPGIADETILQMANRENALLLTSDKDFGELVFRHNRVSAGVIPLLMWYFYHVLIWRQIYWLYIYI